MATGLPGSIAKHIWQSAIRARQRATALFFVLVMLASVLIPGGQVLAEAQASQVASSGDDKPMKTDYPGAEKASNSSLPAAADAQAPVGRPSVLPVGTATPLPGEVLNGKLPDPPKPAERELADRRTAMTSETANADGTITKKHYVVPQFYQKDGKWETIDTTLVEDKNAGDSGNPFGQALGQVQSWLLPERNFQVEKNDWQARFSPSNADHGMVRIKKGDSQVGFSPVGAKDVDPVISKDGDGRQLATYADLWPGVTVQYVIENAAVKENIILKDKAATNKVQFKMLGNARIEKRSAGDKQAPAYAIKGELGDQFEIAPANLILNNFGYENKPVYRQEYKDGLLTVSVDKDYLAGLPDKAFPAVIDPGFNSTFGTRAGGNYVSFASDGTICYSNVCNLYAGGLYMSGGGWRDWRGAFHAPYDQFRPGTGNNMISAKIHLTQRSNESFWTGTWDAHTYAAGHAGCLNSYHCLGALYGQAYFAGAGDIDVTGLYQALIANNDFGGWAMVIGNDGSDTNFKNFDPNNSFVSFTYGGPPPAPTVSSPVANQVFIDPQASFSWGAVQNPNDGGTALQYEVVVSTAPGAAGSLISSGRLSALQWTIPDGILQDGSTYYVQVRSFDPLTQTFSLFSSSVPFRIDLRTGKDSTQAYDTLGPVSIDLATGNASASAVSHSSAALGGNLGISLDYNSPLKSREGLVAKYWNVPANHNGSLPTGQPLVTRVDKNVDFNWTTGSPSAGTINDDWFFGQWTGFFVAPKTGTYQFGGSNDDGMSVRVDGQVVYDSGCYSGICYGTNGISLQAGQVVPIDVQYIEAVGPAYARIYVKGAVAEQVLSNVWLQTGIRPVTAQKGLNATYYGKFDGTNTFSTGNAQLMKRVDTNLSFDWGTGSPMPNGPDGFLARWSGYVTVPAAGTYNFGVRSDDGAKITLDGSTVVYNEWVDRGATESYGSAYTFVGGALTKKIDIEYYDAGGPASFQLKVQGGVPQQIVPTNWLSPAAQVLPDGWSLGIDPDGSVNYDRIKVNQNSAVLSDSSGATHEYAWTGSGYKPPVNEDGYLVRNADGTHTLQDTDGRTYVFETDGTLKSLTSPTDDRKPAALQYTYGSINGGQPAITQITDAVDINRWAKVYYYQDGAGSCAASAPAGFDPVTSDTIKGLLCAVKTNDNRTTSFFYEGGRLGRIAEPGDEITDYIYETVSNNGQVIGSRLKSIRDVAANDAVAAGVRTNDETVKTELSYDIIGRATKVEQPAATAGASRVQHTIEYLPGAEGYTDANGTVVPGYAGITRQHVAGATEPHGFMRQIKYDRLLRTIEDTDIANLTDKTEWDGFKDLTLSTTDEAGLKATTIYDDEDRPIDSYGPAPAAWYGADRKPLAANASQVPHTQSGYDEGITGVSVAWHDYTRQTGNTAGVLSGAPRLHTTGLTPATPGLMTTDMTAPPISPDGTKAGYGFSASGKLRLPAGTYWVNADTSEGIRVWVDDKLVINKWEDAAYRSITGDSFTVAAGQVKRLRVDSYRKHGSTGAFNVSLKQDFGFNWTNDWSAWVKPGYSLTTSSKVYDSTIGDVTSTTNYGTNPELGLAQSATVDPTGINLSTAMTHESQGAAGSYLRPTSNTLPGSSSSNPNFSYTYYGATEARDNPCTTEVESYRQAGFMKMKAEADPDGPSSGGGGSGGAPVVQTSSSGTVSSGSLTLSKPTGTTDGDLLVMTASADLDASENVTYTIPSGWTQLLANTRTHTTNAGNNMQVWYKIASNEPASYVITPDHSNRIGGSILRITGQATSNFIAQQAATVSETGDASAPSVTTTSGNNLIVRFATWDQSKDLVAVPSGHTQAYHVDVVGHDNWGGYKTQATEGSTGVAQLDLSNGSPHIGLTLAIAPDSSTPTGTQVGRTTEAIYDDAGRVVATRINNDPWTCTTFDSRGRVTQTVIPTINGRPGRTLSTDYAYQGSPLKVRLDDSVAEAVEQEVDLLGRSVSGKDQFGNVTSVTYDSFGKVASRTSQIGTETYTYDTYNRVTSYLVGGVAYATVTYDAFSRVQDITYNQAKQTAGGSGTAPVVKSSSSGTVSSGALTLNKPTGAVNGDLLVMTASADLSASENVTYTVPSGWTQLQANTRSDAASAGNNLQVWYRIASNEPASYAVTPDHDNLIGGSITRIDGHDPVNPIDVSAVTASLTGEAAAPSVTTTVNNTLALRIATWDQSKTLNAIPTGHAQSHYVDVSGHDNWGGYKEQATAGSTGVAQLDLSSGAPYVGFTTAIKPAASGSTGNPLKLEQIKRDALHRSAGAVFRFSDGTAFDETVSRSQSGGVMSNTEAFNGSSVTNTYAYDKAGRLLEAVVDKIKHAYGYGAPNASTCSQTSANLNAHKNGNRTSYLRTNTQTAQMLASHTYCYDQADRLLSTSDAQAGTPTYDDHGNMVTLAGGGTPMNFSYDASDNNTAIEQGANRVEYVKTATGAVLRKKEYNNGTLTKSYRYLAGGAIMQSCSLTDQTSCTTTDTYLSLPGGVTLTQSPTNPDTAKRTVYSLKNFHGDTAMTATATGAPSSSVYLYEPYGQASPSQTFGTNSDPANATNAPMGWAASPTRKAETVFNLAVMQMSARVYLPTLGRFTQADPVSGGNANGYVYAVDPINSHDYSGRFLQGGAGAFFFQNAAPPQRVHAAAPAPRIQPSVGYRAVHTPQRATISVARNPAPAPAPAPARVKGGVAPLAVVNTQWFASKAKANQSTIYPMPGLDVKPYNFVQAASSAYDYYRPGTIAGGMIGCVGGAVVFGPGGCIVFGSIGSQVGGVGAAFYGFFEGLRETENAERFNWGTDQLANPWR